MNASVSIAVVARRSSHRDELVAVLHAAGFTTACYDSIAAYRNEMEPRRVACVIVDHRVFDRNSLTTDTALGATTQPPMIYLADDFDLNIVVRLHRRGVTVLREQDLGVDEVLKAVRACVDGDRDATAAAERERRMRQVVDDLTIDSERSRQKSPSQDSTKEHRPSSDPSQLKPKSPPSALHSNYVLGSSYFDLPNERLSYASRIRS